MAITLTGRNNDNGIRPLKPSQDLAGVANLIEEAFASELDRSGRAAIREMRMMGRLGFLLFWMDYFGPDVNSHLNGFVWVDHGHIVGNITVSRRAPASRHWFISNVAVLKSHRGQGLARQLMDTAIEYVREMHGQTVSLQVRQGNTPAEHIYETMGFKHVSASTFVKMYKLEAPSQQSLPPGLRWRGHRYNQQDAQAVYQLARQFYSPGVQQERPLRQSQFFIGPEVQLANLWRRVFRLGVVKHCLIENQSGQCVASLSVEPGGWQSEHQLRLLVHPEWWGQLEAALVNQALAHLHTCPRRPIIFQHPSEHQPGLLALAEAGFILDKTHRWMKLVL
jgi:ribosomal protein S18 acetylase RimI-like enzyme